MSSLQKRVEDIRKKTDELRVQRSETSPWSVQEVGHLHLVTDIILIAFLLERYRSMKKCLHVWKIRREEWSIF